jgi:iron complex outermembrane receptor protein
MRNIERNNHIRRFMSIVLYMLVLNGPVYAQETFDTQDDDRELDDTGIILLPEVEVSEHKETTEYVTQEQMERENSFDLWEAQRNVPGVVRDGGGGMRNASNFTVRGMDEKLMPVYIDGIPLAAPYRGEADSARFLSADLEDVEIQKGYSSMLLGANTFGGAVVMRTARPKKPLDLFYKTSVSFDGIFNYSAITNALGLGTKQELFYGKAVVQLRDVDHTRLSAQFSPNPLNIQQKGDRLFSDTTDFKVTLLAGWTPFETFSLNAEYILQDSDKGVSPEEVEGVQTIFNVWTLWRRQTFSLNGAYNGEKFSGKAVFFLDTFDNTLAIAASTDDVERERYEDPSTYDDYGLGLRFEGAYTINTWSVARLALTYKQDGHKDDKDGTKTKEITENTWSAGGEYEIKPFKPLTFSAGLGVDYFQPAFFWSKDDLRQSDSAFMWSAQAGVFYDITKNHEVHLTFAKKNHIPTMRMRYSETLMGSGDVVPNPGLKPEEAYHYEIGYKGTISYKDKPLVLLSAAVYYSALTNMLAEKTVSGVIQRVNTDKTDYYGFETGLTLFVNNYFSAGGALSINRYRIVYNEAGANAAGNYPGATGSAYLIVNPFASMETTALKTLTLVPAIEYEGRRYGSARMVNINAANVLESYCLFNLKIAVDLNDTFSVSAAVHNLFDKNYYLQDGALPMPGRSFSFSLAAKY